MERASRPTPLRPLLDLGRSLTLAALLAGAIALGTYLGAYLAGPQQ